MNFENQSSSAPLEPAPIPWLTGERIKGAVKLRPQGLLLVCWLIGADDLLMLLFVEPRHWHSPGWMLFLLFGKVVDAWLVWYLWKGRNWARLLLMLGPLLAIFSLVVSRFSILRTETPAHLVATCISLGFYFYLFYWFCRKPIIGFFKAPGNGVSKPALAAEA